MAMQVQPLLLEKETTMLFINTLKAPFITHMIGSTTKIFADIVIAGEMIENAIRDGKIEGEATKRLAPRRKDSEVNNTSTFNTKAITVGQPKTAVVEQQSFQRQESSTRQNSERMQFTPIPVTYRELYQTLYDTHVIAPFHLKPLQPPYPKWYDANARCEYHAGISGHSIGNCTGFKKAEERLIKMGVVKFDNIPNTKNPLSNHSDQGVNAIGEASERRMKEDVEVRMPMKVIWEEMMKRGMLISKNERRETRNYGEFHEKEGYEVQDCEEFKALVQGFIDNKELQIFKGNNEVGAQIMPKVIIHKPTLFPYKDSKRVPWSYDCSMTVPEDESIASTSKDVQAEGSHTWSGKRYDTVGVREEPTKIKNVSAEKEKEAEVPVKEPVKEEEAKEFLKFLKHSEYSVVEQLRRQSARISILALLLSFEVHRDALMKICQNVVRAFDGTKRKVMGRIDIPLEIRPRSELPVPKIARATRMALQMMVGKGALPGRRLGKYLQGGTQIPELKEKRDRFVLGFKPDYKQRRKEVEKRQEGRRARLNGREMEWEPMTFPPISQTFISGGLLIEESH
ncbi:uncharacterized protein [Gossypium hirsutum]|uniref:Gag-pro-like protein n=1 Tax=Gossypium hirsutum TaxID=3635 RepID=A0ABM2YV93_GOSHI|nr:uncharacterized protein LOC121207931 [Gossypium hirsutum]